MSDKKGSLVLLHVIFRHGNRTPDAGLYFPKQIPVNPDDYQPYGLGQLTDDGKKKMIKLGRNLKERYKHLLTESIKLENIDPWSSNVQRTRNSLILILKELIHDDNIEEKRLNFIEIHRDNMFLSSITSIYRNELLKNTKNSIKINNLLKKHDKFLNFLKTHTGIETNSTYGLYRVHDLLITQKYLGISQPNWTREINWDDFNYLVSKHYSETMVETVELQNYLSGRMLEKIINDTNEKITKGNEKILHIYSGHDVNIAGMLGILNLSYDHIPQYGSCIIFEVYENREIKIFYCEEPEMEFELKLCLNLKELGSFLNKNFLL
ncbi:venom acid phosphatase Acph-1-like [Onthophagus taurus]|uniref:venom acid phosphatase Acph-1-like n=1 Tax=Onthophagus taurus TaxID=166361 RepID=UPI0039BDC009